MDTFGWGKMAYWWDEKQGDEGDLWHRALIDPPLLRLAGDVRGLRMQQELSRRSLVYSSQGGASLRTFPILVSIK
jgi:hypothetical protein